VVSSDLDIPVKDKENAKTFAQYLQELESYKALTDTVHDNSILQKSLGSGAYSSSQHSRHNKQVWSFLKGDPGMSTVLNRTFCRCLTSTATAKSFGWNKFYSLCLSSTSKRHTGSDLDHEWRLDGHLEHLSLKRDNSRGWTSKSEDNPTEKWSPSPKYAD